MVDICCIGHITSDKVITSNAVLHMPGGTAYYFSCALSGLELSYLLVTSLGPAEMDYITELRSLKIQVKVQPGRHTVYFENSYGENPDERQQKVLQKADAFTMEQLQQVDAQIFHLGPLLADDIPVSLIKALAVKGHISLDVQGYLRKVVNHKVYAAEWAEKKEALQYIHTLKADEAELRALSGYQDARAGARFLADQGVKEVVITNGSAGSFIYSENFFYTIPAYKPKVIVDATGCGDTYIAAYLYRRLKGSGIQQSAEFAAAMAALKMESHGPFKGVEREVKEFLSKNLITD